MERELIKIIKLLNKHRIKYLLIGGFAEKEKLEGGVTPNNILTHLPVRRNLLLAEIFQHIGAVNRGGLGVDRMYRRLLSYGKLPPVSGNRRGCSGYNQEWRL